jgi:hypothetical protein
MSDESYKLNIRNTSLGLNRIVFDVRCAGLCLNRIVFDVCKTILRMLGFNLNSGLTSLRVTGG